MSPRGVPCGRRDQQRPRTPVADNLSRGLFFRLQRVSIPISRLCAERKEEHLPSLSEYFLKRYSLQYNKPAAESIQRHVPLVHGLRWPRHRPGASKTSSSAWCICNQSMIRKENHSQQNRRGRHPLTGAHRRRPPIQAGGPRRPPRRRASPMPARGTRAFISSRTIFPHPPARGARTGVIHANVQQTRWNPERKPRQVLGISVQALLTRSGKRSGPGLVVMMTNSVYTKRTRNCWTRGALNSVGLTSSKRALRFRISSRLWSWRRAAGCGQRRESASRTMEPAGTWRRIIGRESWRGHGLSGHTDSPTGRGPLGSSTPIFVTLRPGRRCMVTA